MTIPKKIHQLWIPYENGAVLPELVISQCDTWKKHHPHYEYKLWSLPEAVDIAEKTFGPFCVTAMRMARIPAMKADIARLVLLYAFGGYWVDLKLHALKPFLDDFHREKIVLAEHFPTPKHPNPTEHRLLINAFIGAEAKQDLITRVLQIAVSNVLLLNKGGIWGLTGPRTLMMARDEFIHIRKQADFNPLILNHRDTWDKLFKIGSGVGGVHWSKREKNEEIYELV